MSTVRRRRGPSAALGALALLAFAIAGCGDRNVILKVDVHSFLEPSETQASYGPLAPGTGGTTNLTDQRDVNLLTGIGDVVEVVSLEFFAQGIFDNATGSGTGEVVVLFGRPGEAPADSLRFPVTLEAGVSDTLDAAVTASETLAELFREEEVELTLRIEFFADPPPGNPENLAGEFRLTRLLAVLTTSREMGEKRTSV